MLSGDFNATMPVYVTRQTSSGETGQLSISIWMALLVLLFVWLNAVVWGALGLYFAVRLFV